MKLKIDLEESIFNFNCIRVTSFSQKCDFINDSENCKPVPYKNRIDLLCFTLDNTKVENCHDVYATTDCYSHIKLRYLPLYGTYK